MPKALLSVLSILCATMLEYSQDYSPTSALKPQRSDAFKRADLGPQVSKQSSARLISFFDFQFSDLIFSSAELRFGFHDKHALGGAAAQKRSVVKRNTRPRVKRSVTSGERPRNSKNKKAPHCCEAHLCFT